MDGPRTLERLLLDPRLAGFTLSSDTADPCPPPSWVLEVAGPEDAGEVRAGDIVVSGIPGDPEETRRFCERIRAGGACALAVPGEVPQESRGMPIIRYPAWLPRHEAAGSLARAVWTFSGCAIPADRRGTFRQGAVPAAADEACRFRVLSIRVKAGGSADAECGGILERVLPGGAEIRGLRDGSSGDTCLVLRISESLSPGELRSSLRDAARRHGWAIGVSEAFPASSPASEYAPKAREAAVLGMALFGPGHVSFYENLYLYKAFIGDGRPDLLLTFSRDTLNRLRDWDECHGSELLSTLETYFEMDRNAGRTAERLGIHRHTLRQRLERIEEATECPVRGEGAMRYELILAYKHLSKIKL